VSTGPSVIFDMFPWPTGLSRAQIWNHGRYSGPSPILHSSIWDSLEVGHIITPEVETIVEWISHLRFQFFQILKITELFDLFFKIVFGIKGSIFLKTFRIKEPLVARMLNGQFLDFLRIVVIYYWDPGHISKWVLKILRTGILRNQPENRQSISAISNNHQTLTKT